MNDVTRCRVVSIFQTTLDARAYVLGLGLCMAYACETVRRRGQVEPRAHTDFYFFISPAAAARLFFLLISSVVELSSETRASCVNQHYGVRRKQRSNGYFFLVRYPS
jgi:hypothetical protein